MLLAVDAGNTEIKAGLFEGEKLLDVCRLAADPGLPGEEPSFAFFLEGALCARGAGRRVFKRRAYAARAAA